MRSDRFAGALALAALSLPAVFSRPLGAEPGPTSSNKPPMEIAVVDELSWTDRTKLPIAIARALELKATHWRIPVGWGGAETAIPQAYKDALDSYCQPILDAGFTLQITISSSCFGVKPGEGGIFIDRAQLDRYVEFVGDVVSHFKGRCRRYTFWCEPNLAPFMLVALDPVTRAALDQHLFWKAIAEDKSKPEAERTAAGQEAQKIYDKTIFPQNAIFFRDMWTRCQARALQVDPLVKAWFGELANHRGFEFLERCLRGQKFVAEGLAIHPYQFRTAPNRKPPQRKSNVGIGRVRDLQKRLASYARSGKLKTPGGRAVPLFCTEFGYRVEGSMGGITEAKRASWMPRAYEFAARAGVRQMLHYPMFPSDAFPDFKGLLDRDGNPYPAFESLKKWVEKYKSR
ncbi:MAG: hypothetical protein ACAI25_19445 [Planctomycetota bacterium]